MSSFFKSEKVIVCAGSGGVGKTTIAACLGIGFARRGKRVLVLTIDPARRLASALGLDMNDLGSLVEVKVPGQSYKGELFASMIQPQAVFDEFVRQRASSAQAAEKLMRNSLYRQLVSSLSGSQEFTSLERLLSAVQSERYDIVILDTPPTQHAVDFLRAPERIYSLFQESVTKWFAAKSTESGGTVKTLLGKVVERGTHTALRALEKITGSAFVGELGEFFAAMADLQDQVSARSIEVHRLLTSEATSFVLVTGFDHSKLVEAKDFFVELKRGGYRLSGVIVNRSQPAWLELEPLQANLADRAHNLSVPHIERRFLQLYQELQGYYSLRKDTYLKFETGLKGEVAYCLMPELKEVVYGLEGLESMSSILETKMAWE